MTMCPLLQLRHRVRFGLKTLMVAFLVIAIFSALVTRRMHRAEPERLAVKRLTELRAGLFYDYQAGSSICKPVGRPLAPQWLRRWVGEYVFVHVVGVGLYDRSVLNDDLALLVDLPRLEFAEIGSPNVTDVGMDHLRRLPRLEYVLLKRTRVSTARVERLRRELPNCRIDYVEHANSDL